MQSNGGLIDVEAAAGHASWTVLSGPAGGAAGAAFVARQAGAEDALCLDMGGTSCDVCVVDGGSVQERSSGEIAGRPLALPMLAVHTVGAGGGSIAWRDGGGALRVGPRSAGADPGPACYGRGGTEPTVTDANLVLGYLSTESPLGGGVELDRDAAENGRRRARGAARPRPDECAEGIRRVAAAEMTAGAPGRHRAARDRPAPLRADGVRRRRRRCTPRRSPTSSGSTRSCARARRESSRRSGWSSRRAGATCSGASC